MYSADELEQLATDAEWLATVGIAFMIGVSAVIASPTIGALVFVLGLCISAISALVYLIVRIVAVRPGHTDSPHRGSDD